jgi:DNA-binding winged helix-turn-helix (wHTH) protein
MVSLDLQRPSSIGLRPPSRTSSVGIRVRERDLILRFDAYEIDLAQQELRRGGTVVPVEPQVFDVLAYLVQNHGRIISKDELLEAVWQGRIVSDAALTSRISAARRAIGDDGATQTYIRTVHKRGLRFVGDVQADDAAAPAEAEVKDSSPRQIPRGEQYDLRRRR